MSQIAATQEVPDVLTLETGLTFDEVKQRIGLAHAAAGLKHRVVAFYLADVDARGIHQLDGCRTAAQWAAHRFGMGRREARDLGAMLRPRPARRPGPKHAIASRGLRACEDMLCPHARKRAGKAWHLF